MTTDYHGPLLQFSPANSKLRKLATRMGVPHEGVMSMDLLAGKTCPAARGCKAWAVRTPKGTRIRDGKDTEFRCYGASLEARLPATLALHERNTLALRSVTAMAGDTTRRCLRASIDYYPSLRVLRPHSVAGDFFNRKYFAAFFRGVVPHYPEVHFYFYTKQIPYLLQAKREYPDQVSLGLGVLAPNCTFAASIGGKHDHLIEEHGIRSARVVLHPSDAGHLAISEDDIECATPGGDFALLIHGHQPAGSEAARAWYKIINGLV